MINAGQQPPLSLKGFLSIALALVSTLFPPLAIPLTMAFESHGNAAALATFFATLAFGAVLVIGGAVSAIIAFRQIRRGEVRGSWIAIVGLILSALSGVGHLLMTLLYLFLINANLRF